LIYSQEKDALPLQLPTGKYILQWFKDDKLLGWTQINVPDGANQAQSGSAAPSSGNQSGPIGGEGQLLQANSHSQAIQTSFLSDIPTVSQFSPEMETNRPTFSAPLRQAPFDQLSVPQWPNAQEPSVQEANDQEPTAQNAKFKAKKHEEAQISNPGHIDKLSARPVRSDVEKEIEERQEASLKNNEILTRPAPPDKIQKKVIHIRPVCLDRQNSQSSTGSLRLLRQAQQPKAQGAKSNQGSVDERSALENEPRLANKPGMTRQQNQDISENKKTNQHPKTTIHRHRFKLSPRINLLPW